MNQIIKYIIIIPIILYFVQLNLSLLFFIIGCSTMLYYKLNNYQSYPFFQLTSRITSFSLDSLFNTSLLSSNTKGLNLFLSIDNFLVETANHISWYKKTSYYLQSIFFNRFILQININLYLIISFLLLILYLL